MLFLSFNGEESVVLNFVVIIMALPSFIAFGTIAWGVFATWQQLRSGIKDKNSSALLLGSILGGVGGLVLPPIYYWITNPRTLEDAEWAVVFLLTFPVGVVIGAFLGGVVACILVLMAQKKN